MKPIFNVKGVDYFQAENGSIHTVAPLPQGGMIGGSGEDDRNIEHNPTRLHRLQGYNTILDYGCGNGHLVQYLNANGKKATGYDKFNPKYPMKKWKPFDAVVMVEVIEHLFPPFDEFRDAYRLLKKGGLFYIESSFTDILPMGHEYYNPEVGHSHIFSHRHLDDVLQQIGFVILEPINGNVRLYTK
jgi:cyclopropane fatty-acyl-phospholipid synthase-like methyltransferase